MEALSIEAQIHRRLPPSRRALQHRWVENSIVVP